MRYLAIDHGSRRVGLAVCDNAETMASPYAVLKVSDGLIDELKEIIASENIGALVVGLPLNMDGSTGPQARAATGFAEQLKNRFRIPVYFQDERLSSFTAEEKLAQAGFTAGKMKKRLDAVAAAEVLQAFLDSRNSA